MSYEYLFGSATNLFILGWVAIVVAVFMQDTAKLRRYLLFTGGRVIAIALLIGFVVGWLLTRGLPGDITSLAGVLTAYSVPEKVLGAWAEVLGLALLVARWTVDHASLEKVPRTLVLLSLCGTFVAAAIGLLVYLVGVFVWRKMVAAKAPAGAP